MPVPTSRAQPLVAIGTAVVRAASRVRGERAIHAKGTTLTARAELAGGAGTGSPLFDEPGSYGALVRVSRSVGLPDRLPDVLGLAVRLLDAHGHGQHQDLLLDSTHPAPVLRRWPVLRYDLAGALYGSLLPYEVGGRSLLVGARALPGAGPVVRIGDLPVPLRIALLVATPHGPWRQVGVVTTDGVLPAPEGRRIRFNPWTTGGGLVPGGPLQQWRRRAYDASHVGADA